VTSTNERRRKIGWIAGAAGVGLLLALVAVQAASQQPATGRPRGGRSTRSGTIEGRVSLARGASGALVGTAVYVDGAPDALVGAGTPPHSAIHQHGLAFVPAVNVVRVGTTVDFPNDDMVFHNVFSLSRVARFDLGLYRGGDSKAVTFTRAGDVDIYCNIHPGMQAKVKILDTPFFAMVSRDGRYRIEGVPVGTFTLVAWHAFSRETRVPVTVAAGATSTVALEITPGDPPDRHLRKDGTPYGRYR